MKDIIAHGDNINVLLARYGVKFGIYKNGTFHEQLFPFDPITAARRCVEPVPGGYLQPETYYC